MIAAPGSRKPAASERRRAAHGVARVHQREAAADGAREIEQQREPQEMASLIASSGGRLLGEARARRGDQLVHAPSVAAAQRPAIRRRRCA